MADPLSLAFLVLLESFSPEQRAAFLLREVFDHPDDQIAAIVATSEGNARQLVTRARHVEQRSSSAAPLRAVPRTRERLARRFFAAAGNGDLGALEELLAHDVTLHGGGLPGPVTGRARASPAPCWPGSGGPPPSSAPSRCARSRSGDNPARWCSTPPSA